MITLSDSATSRINSEELTLRKSVSHGNEIGAIAATQFEHAAVLHRSGLQPEQGSDGGESVWVGLNMSPAGIRHLIVHGK